MRVLVTGGAGFVGSHLVDGLITQGYQVRIIDNLDPQVHGGSKKRPNYFNKQAEFFKADIRNRNALTKAIKGVDIISHQAAAVGVGQSMYKIHHYTDVNDTGTAQLLELLVTVRNKVKKVIVASSMSAYGEGAYLCKNCGKVYPGLRPEQQLLERHWELICDKCKGLLKPMGTDEEKTFKPTSVYAVNKRTQEELCLSVGLAYKIPTVALRYFNIYGSRQSLSNPYTGVCAIFSSRIKNNHPPLIYEDGQQTRDFIHVQDIVRANLLALKDSRFDYQALNVGSGRPTSILDIARILIKLYRSRVKPKIINQYRAGDIRHCYADISRIQQLGFFPLVSLEEGFREFIEWGKQERAKDRTSKACLELRAKGLTR